MSGCAGPEFRVVRVKTVCDNPDFVGTSNRFVSRYFPPTILSDPNLEVCDISIFCELEAIDVLKYEKCCHNMATLERELTPSQLYLENAKRDFSKNPALIPFIVVGVPTIVPLLFFFEESLGGGIVQTKTERVEGSEECSFFNKNNPLKEPASGIEITVEGFGTGMTDNNGRVSFDIPMDEFDAGVKIIYNHTEETYVVKRTLMTEIIERTAPWYDTARFLNSFSIAYTAGNNTSKEVKKIKIVRQSGVACQVIKGLTRIGWALVIDYVSGKIIGYIIETKGKWQESKAFYVWTILPEGIEFTD